VLLYIVVWVGLLVSRVSVSKNKFNYVNS
jgi:hypothetical protein